MFLLAEGKPTFMCAKIPEILTGISGGYLGNIHKMSENTLEKTIEESKLSWFKILSNIRRRWFSQP